MSSIKESLKLKILKGTPILLEKSNLFFYHRTLNEIIDCDYETFLKIINLFSIDEDDIAKIIPNAKITPFKFFLINLQNEDSELNSILLKGFKFLLNVDKVKCDLMNNILLCSLGEIDNIEITEEGFEEIKYYANIIYNGNSSKEEETDDKELSEKEKSMKDKFDKLRKLREKAKRSEDNENISQFSDMIGGFLSRNMNMGFREVLDLPYYTFFFLLKKLKNYDDYDLQLRAMLAGADVGKKLHHWLMNTDEDEK